jgi:hypothetical protein
MQRVWVRVLVGVVVLAYGCAPAAAASTSVKAATNAEPGVTIDEGSPAAKEYALALTKARHTGASSTHASGSAEEARFGAGITPPSSSGKGGSSAGITPSSSSGGSGSGGTGSGGARTAHTRERGAHGTSTTSKATSNGADPGGSASSLRATVLRADHTTASGGDGSLLALLGGGVAILVLGGLGGVVLRHSRRPPSHA